MPRRSALWNKLDAYFQALETSELADKSVEDYYYFAECFVRWCDGTFTPGAGKNTLRALLANGKGHVNGNSNAIGRRA